MQSQMLFCWTSTPSQRHGDREERGDAAGPEASGGHLQPGIDRLKRQTNRTNRQRETHHRRRQYGSEPGEHDLNGNAEATGMMSPEYPTERPCSTLLNLGRTKPRLFFCR